MNIYIYDVYVCVYIHLRTHAFIHSYIHTHLENISFLEANQSKSILNLSSVFEFSAHHGNRGFGDFRLGFFLDVVLVYEAIQKRISCFGYRPKGEQRRSKDKKSTD